MPEDYFRIDLRLPQKLNEELEKFQSELYEQTGKKMSRNVIIREMVKSFLENPSRSCFSKREAR
jgi:tetrahydromethanopterin S-methyltransferase subunit G